MIRATTNSICSTASTCCTWPTTSWWPSSTGSCRVRSAPWSRLGEAGVLLGLVSGAMEGAARTKLIPANLNRFFIFGAYGSDSPDRPELTRLAIEKAAKLHGQLKPSQVFVVGDTPRPGGGHGRPERCRWAWPPAITRSMSSKLQAAITCSSRWSTRSPGCDPGRRRRLRGQSWMLAATKSARAAGHSQAPAA